VLPSLPVIDRRARTPLHQQIYEHWRDGVLSGRFRPGERVQSTRELAETLGLSRITVTAAYDQLIAEGYLESKRGSGTFVCRELPDQRPRPARPAAVPVRRGARSSFAIRAAAAARVQRRPCRLASSTCRGSGRISMPSLPRLAEADDTAHASPGAGLFDRSPRAAGFAPLREEIAR
jgi:GntR family transcriptional regulator/MocR family aminotransferase